MIGALLFSAASLVVFMVFFRMAMRLIGFVASSFGSLRTMMGSDVRFNLIAFGVAVWFLPQVVGEFARAIPTFVLEILRSLPSQLQEVWFRNAPICGLRHDAFASAQCVVAVTLGVLNGVSAALNAAYRTAYLDNLPYGELIAFLAIWAVVGLLLPAPTSGSNGRTWWVSQYGALSSTTRESLALLGILLMGLYLSIAAIAAVPTFETGEKVDVEQEAKTLETMLAESLPSEKSFLGQFDEVVLGDDVFADAAAAAKRIGDGASSKSAADVGFVKGLADYVSSGIAAQRARRGELAVQWKQARSDGWNLASKLKADGISGFKAANLRHLGTAETQQHRVFVAQWFVASVDAIKERLRDCRQAINEADEAWGAWAGKQQAIVSADEQAALPSPSFGIAKDEELSAVDEAFSRCILDRYAGAFPSRPRIGGNLGWFEGVAGWLIQTESLSLALITGLLGFGLLGAAASSFVREQARSADSTVAPMNIPQVLIRGISAAVVIFLGVKGGLAMFAASRSEPNPYVLFFTCLVAATFGEVVWNWAKQKLVEGLGKAPDRPSAAPPPPAPLPPRTPPAASPHSP